MGSKKPALIIGLLLFVAIATGIYFGVVPEILSRQYMERVDAAARPLESDFRDLDKSTELPLVDDPSAPTETKKKNATDITQYISSARQRLATLKKVNNSLAPLPYSTLLGQYGKAEVLHDHAERLIGESEDALNGYETLMAYIETFDKAADGVTAVLSNFNQAGDLDAYSGQSQQMQEVASTIRADVAQLSKAPHPSDMASLNDAAVAAFTEASNGFDDLANGLMIPADDPIYAAAQRIEDATSKVENVTGTMYDNSLDQSRTIKNVQDLNEKLELVLG